MAVTKRTMALAVLLAPALALACGGDTTIDGGGGQGGGTAGQGGTAVGGAGGVGGQGQGGSGQPNGDCLALCALAELSCSGPDTEGGSATISDGTASGCTASVELPYSGSYTVVLDCVAEQACVTAGSPSCVGTAGECYPATFGTSGFSYHLPNCAHGSLSCFP